jgi:hypothetical protein
MPGVRLNFSKSGISTSIGPRGAGINLSSRGNTMHVGIPGTGLSYRSSLSHSGSRSQLARWERQQAAEADRAIAVAAHDSHQQQLASLSDILQHRVTESVDWLEEYAPHPPFQPSPFAAPQAPTRETAVRELHTANSLVRWMFGIAAAAGSAALAPQPWLRWPMAAVAVYWTVRCVMVLQRRGAATDKFLVAQLDVYNKLLAAAKAAHVAEQEAARTEYVEGEEFRARLRAIETSQDADLAAKVLEVELSNEDLPVSIAFDIHFDGLRNVSLAIDLPDLSEIPETNTLVTKTGKLSERPMAVRDRSALYRDVCAGVALRLVHETYRVLPFVQHVTAVGLAERPIRARNEPRYSALTVATDRQTFGAYDLDSANPSGLLLALGGHLSSARDGSLKSLSENDD